MNKSTHLVGTGIAVLVGSVLAVAPVAVDALAVDAPTYICLEDTSIGACKANGSSVSRGGGTGSRVAVQELPNVYVDAKDHPNYGQITPAVYPDAKDHPNYGQATPETRDLLGIDVPLSAEVTPEVRIDAKDHPNYGPVTPEADSGSGSVGLGGGRAAGRSYAV
jgi:hypothetical protein